MVSAQDHNSQEENQNRALSPGISRIITSFKKHDTSSLEKGLTKIPVERNTNARNKPTHYRN
jgi:hypothetical protein